eukprot:SAG31_NODE_1263_length_9072_cov_9.389390_8_plen_137_part_00
MSSSQVTCELHVGAARCGLSVVNAVHGASTWPARRNAAHHGLLLRKLHALFESCRGCKGQSSKVAGTAMFGQTCAAPDPAVSHSPAAPNAARASPASSSKHALSFFVTECARASLMIDDRVRGGSVSDGASFRSQI